MAINSKDQARPMPIPNGRESVEDMSTPSQAIGPEPTDNMQEPTNEEMAQVDFLLGSIKDFIWDEGYDQLIQRMETNKGDLSKEIGDIAGELVNEEVKAAEQTGTKISRNILLGIGSEVINELAEVAVHEKLIELKGDKRTQDFQGEALYHAINKYGELGDVGVNPVDSINQLQTILKGQAPESEIVAKMGVQVPQDAPQDEILMEETVSG
jgi:hypothetical protein